MNPWCLLLACLCAIIAVPHSHAAGAHEILADPLGSFDEAAPGGALPFAAAEATPPSLSITNRTGQFIISWPATATSWVLQHSPHWPPLTWERVSPSLYQTNERERFLAVTAPQAARFYRLYQPPPPAAGLTGFWSVDEGAGAVTEDGSVAARTMALSRVSWVPGRVGPGGLRFHGGGADTGGSLAWVNNANHQVLPGPGQPFSVSFWFSPDTLTPGFRGLAGNAVSGSSGWYVALRTLGLGTNELIFAATGAADSLNVTGRTLLVPGQWHQVTVTYDGVEGKLYLDAALLGQDSGPVPTHAGPIYFGGGVAGYDSLVGRLDEIRTHINELTQEQVALRGHWRFEESSGEVLADSSVAGHHARLSGASARVDGRVGQGVNLAVSQIEIPNPDFSVLPESGGGFGLSCWLRPDEALLGRSGLFKCGAGGSDGWQLTLEPGPNNEALLHFDAKSTGGTLDLWASMPLPSDIWTKLDLSYNGGIATVYVNGRKVQSQNGAIQGSLSPLRVGTVPGTATFRGTIDDLKIYSRERDAAEIGPVSQVMWETVHRLGATNLMLRGFGPPGRALTYRIVPGVTPTNGSVSQLGPGSPQITFQAGDRKGPDAFTYTVSDGEFTTEPTLVVMSIVEPHWLSPAGGSSGTRDGRSPDRAWLAGPADALDAIWRTNNYYDAFYYAPGVYETRGWKHEARATAAAGCKHIGSGAEGPERTLLRLVDIWEPAIEEMIFAPRTLSLAVDNFEVHQMTLDCNAANLPKLHRGRPEWIRVPLAATGRVDSVTLRWAVESIPSVHWVAAHASEFTLRTRRAGVDTFVTNCMPQNPEGEPDHVPIGAEADEILIELNQRASGVDYYGLKEVEVTGVEVSRAQATTANGTESRLASSYSFQEAVDGDASTAWASGAEDDVRLLLPLASGTVISQLNLRWNCRTVEMGRLGPALTYTIQARDEITGLYQEVPFVRHGRAASGWETNTFGTVNSTNPLVTDRLLLRLISREPGVDHYSLRELALRNGAASVRLRQPAASSILLFGGNHSALKAFDQDPNTWWACNSQGAASAITVAGNNLKFTRLKIVGFGTRAGRECFPMFLAYLGNDGKTSLGNVLVEDCVISDPAPGNPDGISAIDMFPNPPSRLTNAIVRRCTVRGLKRFFLYSNGIAASVMEQCVVDDCKVGVYFEPEVGNIDDVGAILIRSNLFSNVTHGIYLQHHADSFFDSLTGLDNEIVLDAAGGYGLAVCDVCDVGPAGSVTNLTFLNNLIRYEGWAAGAPNGGGGMLYSDIQHAVLGNNLVALDSTRAFRVRSCPAGFIPPDPALEDCDHPRTGPPGEGSRPPCVDQLLPGYKRAWFNNRTLSGELLPVRISNFGAETLATQQQWTR